MMRSLRLAAVTGSLALLLTSAGLARATDAAPIVIAFVKDCPVLTCEETSASPVDVQTVVTPVKLSGWIFHYTAIETFTSADGSLTVSLSGILNLAQTPNATVLQGVVVEGTWDGVDLSGARVYAEATRLFDTTFGGSVSIFPASAS